ncbi:unnamed protein product [Rotaria sp. Silwood2]|nr:unnamed protein product [Rotaria sp. Silwood2]CAF4364081.1 unnamed protein product [Rotaria sp. Silwood2]
MYSAPSSGGSAAKTSLPVIGTICCGALLLFLLAATIVLALIPIYTATKSAALNSNALKSNEITMYLQSSSINSGRRRRQSSPISALINCMGGTFGPSGIAMLESGIHRACSSNKKFADVTVSSVTVAAEGNSRRKRFSLTKRQDGKFMFVVKLFIYFTKTCALYQCQVSNGALLKSLLLTNLASSVSLTDVPILNSSGGLCATISYIPILGVLIPGGIGPSGFPFAVIDARPTIAVLTSTSTTTTSTASQNIG